MKILSWFVARRQVFHRSQIEDDMGEELPGLTILNFPSLDHAEV